MEAAALGSPLSYVVNSETLWEFADLLVTLSVVTLTESLMPSLLPPESITQTSVVGACLVVAGSLMTALGRA